MMREALMAIPDGQLDDGLSCVDPVGSAMPTYCVIADNRPPVALRDLMIAPVRSEALGL